VVFLRVLLSINPVYAYKIFNGEKKFEFRRRIFKRKNVKTIILYSTCPICKITGRASIERIVTDTTEALWLQCAPYSGMEEQDFFHYFRGITTGFAIEMNHIIQFDEPIDPQDLFPQFVPPQSFCYLADDVHIP